MSSNSTAQSSPSMASLASQICSQIAAVFAKPTAPHPPALDLLLAELSAARHAKVFLYGVGREGLMLRALAMRLAHLGLQAHAVLDVTVPPVGPGDLLVASAGPGGFGTVEAVCAAARGAGARVLLLTAQPEAGTTCVRLASCVAYVPAQTMADDGGAEGVGSRPVMLMGSVYEGALFVLFEMVVYLLGEELGQSVELIRSRHTKLE